MDGDDDLEELEFQVFRELTLEERIGLVRREFRMARARIAEAFRRAREQREG